MPNFGIDSSLLPATPRDPWREQLTLLLDSTGDGMFGIDLTGICTFINRAGAGMLGYSVEQRFGRNMHALIHHSHPDGSHYTEDDSDFSGVSYR